MKMERINENTIRVLIENEDLIERGITFLDLLGNHRQIESFFHDILLEVDVDEQFQETDVITFQVVPNRNGLELVISKNLPMNEALDFSSEEEAMGELSNWEGQLSDFVKEQLSKSRKAKEKDDKRFFYQSDFPEMVVSFESFESFIQLAQSIQFDSEIMTDLYQLASQYFLHIRFVEELDEALVLDELSAIYEFAHQTSITPEVLGEYGKLVIEEKALEVARQYFK